MKQYQFGNGTLKTQQCMPDHSSCITQHEDLLQMKFTRGLPRTKELLVMATSLLQNENSPVSDLLVNTKLRIFKKCKIHVKLCYRSSYLLSCFQTPKCEMHNTVYCTYFKWSILTFSSRDLFKLSAREK